jgi:Ca2+-binding EF-hand superfamily protein
MDVENCNNNNNDYNRYACSGVPMTTWGDCELQNLRDAFDLLDTENKGEICVDELRSTLEELRTLKNDITGARNIQCLLVSLRSFKSDTKLSLNDFVSLMTSPSPNYLKDDVEKVYDLFDTSGKGFINMEDLRTVAKDLGERNISDAEMHEMIQRVSSSGRVTLDQFREIMKNNILL